MECCRSQPLPHLNDYLYKVFLSYVLPIGSPRALSHPSPLIAALNTAVLWTTTTHDIRVTLAEDVNACKNNRPNYCRIRTRPTPRWWALLWERFRLKLYHSVVR